MEADHEVEIVLTDGYAAELQEAGLGLMGWLAREVYVLAQKYGADFLFVREHLQRLLGIAQVTAQAIPGPDGTTRIVARRRAVVEVLRMGARRGASEPNSRDWESARHFAAHLDEIEGS